MELDMKASSNGNGRPDGATRRYLTLMLLRLLMLSYFCSSFAHSSKPVPPEKWKELSAVKGNQQFIYKHLSNKKPPGADLSPEEQALFNDTAAGFNPNGVNIVSGQVAEPAGCQPLEQAVKVPPSSDATIIRWPPCAKIPQCGGCCGTDVLECIAIRTEPTSIQVMKVKYSDSGSGDFEFYGLEDVTLTRHLECDCRCRIQPHHCTPQKQYYNEQSCSCRCHNENEATSCSSLKIWNDKECACVCSRILNCLDDEFFSINSCSCQRKELSTAAPLAATPNPCPGLNCRAGYQAVYTGTSCTCRLQSRSVALRSRSAIGNRHWSRGSSDFDLSLD